MPAAATVTPAEMAVSAPAAECWASAVAAWAAGAAGAAGAARTSRAAVDAAAVAIRGFMSPGQPRPGE